MSLYIGQMKDLCVVIYEFLVLYLIDNKLVYVYERSRHTVTNRVQL